MKHQEHFVKEVRCQIFNALFQVLEEQNIPPEKLTEGLPVDPAYLKKSSNWVSWELMVEVFDNLEKLQIPNLNEEIHKYVVPHLVIGPIQKMLGLVTGPRALYRIIYNILGPQMFPVIRHQLKEMDDGRLLVDFTIPDHYRSSPLFMELCLEAAKTVPQMVGLQDAQIESKGTDRHGIFFVTMPASKSIISRIFNVWKVLSGTATVIDQLEQQQKSIASGLQTLSQQQIDFRNMIDQLSEAVGVHSNGELIYVNNAFAHSLELDPTQRHSLKNVFHFYKDGTDTKRFLDAEIEQPPESNFALQLKDGKKVFIRFISTSKINFRGEPGTLIVFEDYTEKRQALDTINEQQMRLEESTKLASLGKMAALGEMAAGVAHEINNPLGIIRGRAEIVKMWLESGDYEVPKVTSELAEIEKTTDRIARIIQGLRHFSREGGKTPVEHAPLKEIIDDTLSFCMEKFKSQGVSLTVPEYPDDLRIECRPTEIAQVLLNLLNNAFDSTVEAPDKWIKIEIFGRSKHVQIKVSDGGRGIPNNVKDKIFQPFFTTKKVGAGTGLGLSISKGIIENHQGSLELDPFAVQTTFIVELPLSEETANY